MNKLFFLSAMVLFSFTAFGRSGADGESSSKKENQRYGNNIISFHPVHLVADNHVGVGFAYERLVNPYLGIKIPIMKSVNSDYINVGIEAKLYPGKHNGAVRYAIAPALMYGTGDETFTDYVYDPMLGYSVAKTVRSPRTHFGFLLNQTLNITIVRQLYVGIDGGLGVNYYDQKFDRWSNTQINNNITLAAQFHMALGFRF